MKIFAIRDEADPRRKDLAFLLYYEHTRQFYIELPNQADPWDTPLLLSSFAEKGVESVNSYWSRLWVQQRIVPPDRQNIQQILRENGLKEYDEYALLILAKGRCAQDDYYLVPLREEQLPEEIRARFEWKLEDMVPLSENKILLFFRNGTVRKCDLTAYFSEHREFAVLLAKPEYFKNVQLQPGGYGITWGDSLMIDHHTLAGMGVELPLSHDDFCSFVRECVINTQEAAELLNCSRQYVNELVRNQKLHPIRATEKNTLFLKSEILKRNWQ